MVTFIGLINVFKPYFKLGYTEMMGDHLRVTYMYIPSWSCANSAWLFFDEW